MYKDILLLLCAILIIILTVIYIFFEESYNYWKKLGIPHPKTELFFGNLKDIVLCKETLADQLNKFYKKYKEKGCKYIGIYLFHEPYLLVFDPFLIKCVLSKDFEYFFDRGTYCNEEGDPISAHLFSLEGKYVL